MPWEIYQEIEALIPLPDQPGKALKLKLRIPDDNPRRIALCRLFTKIGDITTAGRRRSWFFESIYSKTHFGWVGYSLIKDILLHGKHTKSTHIQYRMTWDRMHATWYRSEF